MNEELVYQLTIPKSILSKWQRLIDALAKLMDVPVALVMKYEYPYLKAFISSNTEENPIPPNYEEEIFGTYCEETIGSKEIHEVQNALKHPQYKNKPGLKENNLVSYLGFPLEWPTGEIFGTICVMDKEERQFTVDQKNLMREMKVAVDAHLELIFKNELLKNAHEKIKEQRDNLQLLTSTVRHEIANNLTYIKGFLDIKEQKSELPEDFKENLLPEVKRSLESIEHIKRLEKLFTEKKKFEEIQPREILERIKDEFSGKISIKSSCIVEADEFLDLLLNELIRNAFKHTDTPKVDIILSESDETSKIELQDYGPGLPESVVNSHFEYKTEERELRGLTIVEKIMNRYGGKINYEKNEKGSLFKLIWYKEKNKI